ncbi:chemotaxis protein CheB [Lysobacter arvi]|nr:chemotaxis protein CheB [Lysobacter arvi]
MPAAAHRNLIVIGGSAGAMAPLLDLVAGLPRGFAASILIVQHIGAHNSVLPELLTRRGPLPALFPISGRLLEPGVIFVAPPDHHLLVIDGAVRLSRDPKENHARPAIDPLFRSAAIAKGPRVIGVLLSGWLDDGVAGLQAIKACGGLAVVQAPQDAEEPEMPDTARRYVAVDDVLPAAEIARALTAMTSRPIDATPPVPAALIAEHALSVGESEDAVATLDRIGTPSRITCPECSGVLWEIKDAQPPRYRCHTGHGYSIAALDKAQGARTDQALWSALRVLHERERLLREMAAAHRRRDALADAERVDAEADHIAVHAQQLQHLASR